MASVLWAGCGELVVLHSESNMALSIAPEGWVWLSCCLILLRQAAVSAFLTFGGGGGHSFHAHTGDNTSITLVYSSVVLLFLHCVLPHLLCLAVLAAGSLRTQGL